MDIKGLYLKIRDAPSKGKRSSALHEFRSYLDNNELGREELFYGVLAEGKYGDFSKAVQYFEQGKFTNRKEKLFEQLNNPKAEDPFASFENRKSVGELIKLGLIEPEELKGKLAKHYRLQRDMALKNVSKKGFVAQKDERIFRRCRTFNGDGILDDQINMAIRQGIFSVLGEGDMFDIDGLYIKTFSDSRTRKNLGEICKHHPELVKAMDEASLDLYLIKLANLPHLKGEKIFQSF